MLAEKYISEKHYYDFMASLQTSFREGKEEGIEQGKQLGIEQGKQLGEEKKIKELVINAHKTGLTNEQISQITLMPMTEIEKIIAAYH